MPSPSERPGLRATLATLPYFLRLIWQAAPRSAAALACTAIAQAPVAAAAVWGLGELVAGLTSNDLTRLIWGAGALVGSAVLGVVTYSVSALHADRLRYATEVAAERLALQHMSRLPYATLEDPNFQRYVTAFDRNGWIITNLSEQTRRVLTETLSIVGYAAALWVVPWEAALVMLFAIAAKIALLRKAADTFWEVTDMETKEGRRARYYNHMAINGALATRIIGAAPRFIAAWDRLVTAMLAKRNESATLSARANFLSGLVEAAGFGIGLYLVLTASAGVAAASAVAVFVAAYRQAAAALDGIVGNVDWFLKYSHHFPLVKAFFDAPEEADEGADLPAKAPVVRFEDVWFRYPGTDRDVLCGVSFTLTPGEDVALVGLNGAGKSTLLRLLLGTYRPTRGRITVAGLDLTAIRPSAWRQAIAMLPQDLLAFDDTVEAQVLYGDQQAEKREDRFATALATSGLRDLAATLPRGLATHAGRKYGMPEDEPIELSGGQRQIVAIARTLYQDAKVYVFDEPTSAVDAEKEERFFEALPEALAGRTAVFVAHRFSTIRRAKRIVVMDDGRIIEDGTHEELMARSGRYAELFTLQAKMYQ